MVSFVPTFYTTIVNAIDTLKAKVKSMNAPSTVQEMILGLLRHVLTTFGGGLVAAGTIDNATLQIAIGAILTLIGVVWSTLNKQKLLG